MPRALLDNVENVRSDRSSADVLYETILKLGLPLSTSIEQRHVGGLVIHGVGGGVLMACLAERIPAVEVDALAAEIVRWRSELAPAGDSTALFIDAAFADDVSKTNLSEILTQEGFRVRTI